MKKVVIIKNHFTKEEIKYDLPLLTEEEFFYTNFDGSSDVQYAKYVRENGCTDFTDVVRIFKQMEEDELSHYITLEVIVE